MILLNRVSSPTPTRSTSSTSSTTDRAARSTVARQEALVDAALVSRFKAGDETAFVEIVARHRTKLTHTAFRLLHNQADAEEIAQDALIRAHRGLADFRGDSSLGTWLHLIALNLARNRYWYFRRRHRHDMLSLDAAAGEAGTAPFAEVIPCEDPGPVSETTTREFSAIIDDCMTRLTTDQQQILTLRNVRHQSYGHISQALGLRVGTVKSRIARARNQLRALLLKACPELSPKASPFAYWENLHASGQQAVA